MQRVAEFSLIESLEHLFYGYMAIGSYYLSRLCEETNMRTLSEAEILTVSGAAERYPGGAQGWRDGEHGAMIGTAILDVYMSFQPGGANYRGTATAFGTNVYYQQR